MAKWIVNRFENQCCQRCRGEIVVGQVGFWLGHNYGLLCERCSVELADEHRIEIEERFLRAMSR